MDNKGLILLNVFAFIILFILVMVFFTKERLHKSEDSTYGNLLVVSIITILFGILLGYTLEDKFRYCDNFSIIFDKIYLIGLIVTIAIFAFYTYCISHSKSKNFKLTKKLFIILSVINSIIILLLPLKMEIIGGLSMPQGSAMNYTYLIFGLTYILLIILIFTDLKNIKNKKYIPIFFLILEGFALTITQVFFPSINYIINPSTVITCLIMYFTIENPDVKMIEELTRNKKIIEKANEDKSNLVFKMSQEIKNPVNYIYDLSKKMIETKDIKNAESINISSRKLSFLVNDILDLSNLNPNNVVNINNKYNINILTKELESYVNKNKNHNVNFTVNVDSNVPDVLYGDSVKIKQILLTLLLNSCKYTKEGFIELNISSINKYDVTRLIITVEDSGKGMNIYKVNELLDYNNVLIEKEINNINIEDLNLKVLKTILTMLNGGLNIKSEENKGTETKIIIDQKIFKETSSLNKYNIKNKILLLSDDDYGYNILNQKNIQIEKTIYPEDLINKIKNNEKYKLIIMKDNMTPSALTTLKILKQNKNFNIPVIVLLNKNKESISKYYIEDGFTDCIINENIEKEINKIKRFIK